MGKELVKVILGNNNELLVSARDLHEYFESKERFSKWFARMCEYGFEENVDFTSVQKSTVVNNGAVREIGDYACTIDMAKEISMLQRTDKGREARKYFIECEKHLREVANQSPVAFAKSLSLNRTAIKKNLPSFLTYKNVEDITNTLVERIENEGKDGAKKRELMSALISSIKEARDRTSRLSDYCFFSDCIIQIEEKRYEKGNQASGGKAASTNRKIKKLEKEKQELEEKLEQVREVISEADRASMAKYRKDINSNVRYKAFLDNKTAHDVFVELYKRFEEETNIDIRVEFAGYSSYIGGIEEKGCIELMRILHRISKEL